MPVPGRALLHLPPAHKHHQLTSHHHPPSTSCSSSRRRGGGGGRTPHPEEQRTKMRSAQLEPRRQLAPVPAPAAMNVQASGAAAGANGNNLTVLQARTRAQIILKVKVILLLLLVYSTTALVSLGAAFLLDTSVVSKAPVIVMIIYISHRFLTYVALKPVHFLCPECACAKVSLPYLCFAVNLMAGACFSTSFFGFMSLRETMLVPFLLMATLPYAGLAYYKAEPLTLRWLIISTGYALLFLFTSDEDAWLPLPGKKNKMAYVGSAISVWFLLDDVKDYPSDGRPLDGALNLYRHASLDAARHLAAALVCSIIIGA